MQITIGKKLGSFIGAIALLLLVVLGIVLSQNTNKESRLTGADTMFLQMMIPHHQQAVDISELALRKSNDPELRALAESIRDGQRAEIITMKAWLKDAHEDLEMGHMMGDSMGGMLTESDLSDLNLAEGKEFDLLWLAGMTNHHEGAIHMTTMIEDANKQEIKNFGAAIVATQSAQIEQMSEMIKRLNS